MLTNNHGRVESKKCDYVEFQNHPLPSKRAPCGETLLNKIKIGTNFKFIPRKTYMYYSIIESLKSMAIKKGFLEKCNLWRTRSEHFSLKMMGDIYDGRLWKDMMYINDTFPCYTKQSLFKLKR